PIFRSASKAIAWLNDIESWRGLEASLQWLCFTFLKQEEPKPKTFFRYLKSIFGGLSRHSLDALLKRTSKLAFQIELGDFSNELEPNPWFTSLWTYQEVCLRPDMLICNERWDPVMLADDTPISLVVIV